MSKFEPKTFLLIWSKFYGSRITRGVNPILFVNVQRRSQVKRWSFCFLPRITVTQVPEEKPNAKFKVCISNLCGECERKNVGRTILNLPETEEEKGVCNPVPSSMTVIKGLHSTRSPHLPCTGRKRIQLDSRIRNPPECCALRKTWPFPIIM